MKTEKLSLPRRVTHLLATVPEGLRSKEITERLLGTTPQTVSVAVWKLKQAGTVSHDKVTGVYKLTDVNTQKAQETKASKPIAQKVEIVEHKRPMQKLQKQVDELSAANAEMNRHWRTARDSSLEFERKYFDALAVIAYLEARLAK
jgi:DNA-binding IclR family transcriptional regulator